MNNVTISLPICPFTPKATFLQTRRKGFTAPMTLSIYPSLIWLETETLQWHRGYWPLPIQIPNIIEAVLGIQSEKPEFSNVKLQSSSQMDVYKPNTGTPFQFEHEAHCYHYETDVEKDVCCECGKIKESIWD